MKTNRHTLMAKGIMVLLALLVLIFAITYAWFVDAAQPAYANSITASNRSGVDFEVAIGFETAETGYNYTVSDFVKSTTLTNLAVTTGSGNEAETHYYDLLANYSPKDVTGNGRDLYIPELINDPVTGRRVVKANTTSATAVTPNREYISFDMLFKCERACHVYIDEGSFIKAACESSVGNGDLTNDVDADNKSSKGDFSKDAVVGAMRVAFVDYNSSMNLNNIYSDINDNEHLNSSAQFIWLPRTDMYLDDTTTPDWTLHTAHDEADFYENYGDITMDHQYYDPTKGNSSSDPDSTYVGGVYQYTTYQNTINECNSNTVVPVDIYHAPEESPGDTNAYYLGKCRVNIWVEGMDAEARRAIAGGKFSINFDLRAG